MTSSIDRRGALGAGLALGLSLVVPKARACEFFTTGFTVVHPWTRATAPDATSATVFMKFIDVQQADRLIAVETPVAQGAEMTTEGATRALDLVILKGETLELREGGGIQLRLVDLAHRLEPAREYPMTLVFERAGRLAATLNIDYARFG